MPAACQANPAPPTGFRVWRAKAVPKPLEAWAIELRDRWMPAHNYGETTSMWYTDASGQQQMVLARKDYHSWTYHQGRLVTGICIPGITLYESLLTPALSGVGVGDLVDDTVPDPTAARYSQDLGTDWGLVGATAAAAVAVVVAFWAGLKFAGKAAA